MFELLLFSLVLLFLLLLLSWLNYYNYLIVSSTYIFKSLIFFRWLKKLGFFCLDMQTCINVNKLLNFSWHKYVWICFFNVKCINLLFFFNKNGYRFPLTCLPARQILLLALKNGTGQEQSAVNMVVDCIAVYYTYFTYDTVVHKYM